MQKRLRGQEAMLKESRETLDAAVSAGMLSLVSSITPRVKRQSDAVKMTRAAAQELQAKIEDIEMGQADLVNNLTDKSKARK